MKKTVVIGASPNPDRYAHRATTQLAEKGHEVIPVGLRKGEIHGIEIVTDRPEIDDVDTVTLYVGPKHQDSWKSYIDTLHPKRIIFNPGTQNPSFEKHFSDQGIEVEHACTLVQLSIGNY
jgi:predicted CoA-binding protein